MTKEFLRSRRKHLQLHLGFLKILSVAVNAHFACKSTTATSLKSKWFDTTANSKLFASSHYNQLIHLFLQIKPPNWSNHLLQQIDKWLFAQIGRVVVAKAKGLEREQFRMYLSETLLRKSILPADISLVRHVIDAMFPDYFA